MLGCVVTSLDPRGDVVASEAVRLAPGEPDEPGRWAIAPVAEADPLALARAYSGELAQGRAPALLDPALPGLAALRAVVTARPPLATAGHLLATSGTTGGAPRLHAFALPTALGNAEAHLASLHMAPGEPERVLCPLPLHHGFGLVAALLGTCLTGGELLACASAPGPATLLELVARHEATTLYLTPPLARLLLRHAARRSAPPLPSLRRVSVGSAALDAGELRALLTAVFPGARGFFTYGLTEAGPRVSTLDAGTSEAPGACLDGPGALPIGAPLAGVALAIRGGALALRTRWAADGARAEDGWLETADDAREDAAGVWVLGRRDGAIVRGGVTIYPEDVEGVAARAAGVGACCVVARPSPLYGQVPVLAWEAAPGADPAAARAALEAALEAGLAPAQRPVEVRQVARLPRTALGKIRRAAVRGELAA